MCALSPCCSCHCSLPPRSLPSSAVSLRRSMHSIPAQAVCVTCLKGFFFLFLPYSVNLIQVNFQSACAYCVRDYSVGPSALPQEQSDVASKVTSMYLGSQSSSTHTQNIKLQIRTGHPPFPTMYVVRQFATCLNLPCISSPLATEPPFVSRLHRDLTLSLVPLQARDAPASGVGPIYVPSSLPCPILIRHLIGVPA